MIAIPNGVAGTTPAPQGIKQLVNAVLTEPWTAQGRVRGVEEKFGDVDGRHRDFVERALPRLRKHYPTNDICKGSKGTTQKLDRYELPN